MRVLSALLAVLGLTASPFSARAQAPADSPVAESNDSVRVNVTLNQDGSRTSYRFDPANHKATATTNDRDGKPQSKIEYELDDLGRFGSARIYGPDGKFQFRSVYKYDAGNRLQEETKYSKDNKLLGRIVYSYDGSGKQTGYSVYDANGKLLGQTSPIAPTPPPKQSKKSR